MDKRLNLSSKTHKWLADHVAYAGAGCLTWPFGLSRGYGHLGFDGKTRKAHRVMCELAHGPAPSLKHETAHSCGKGHEGCVNPRHLSWKTRTANQRDRCRHGTAGPQKGPRYRLTPEDAAAIFRAMGKATVTDLAAKYKVTRSTVRQIHLGKIWQNSGRQRAVEFRRLIAGG